PHRLSADRHALADGPVWRRSRAVAHRVRPGTHRLCPAGSRYQTRWGRKLPSSAIRSLLRFLVFSGEVALGLDAAVPTPRQWMHATLPARLTVAEVERALATWTGDSPTALRNHAILLLLARLGVRAYEVAALCLEDIHWYEGQVRLS